MTPLVLLLAAVQAGLLLWAVVQLSNIALRPKKGLPIFWSLLALAGSLAIARYGSTHDRYRAVCGVADCLVLALSVAGIRLVVVNKEQNRLASEYEESNRRAAEAVAAARRARKDEQLRAATALLETRATEAEKPGVESTQPPRHLTPSLLRGGTPSPRLPASPRK
jgi:hypothetical protein